LRLPIGIYDDESIKRLKDMNALEELSLDSSKVTDASIDTLGGLKNLRTLHLGRTGITEAGREKLRSLLPKTTIMP
jgi:hypothetical protein